MIKPERLRKGDKVAIVSLSSGMLGEDWAIHKLEIAKQRLESDFGLQVVVMDNALKGIDYLYSHPEKRAEDLMNAFLDCSIKGIINAIGGDDSIRLLPYIDFDVIKNNPKVFMGFSDTTSIHLMIYKAGLMSYYGGALMTNWAEYIKINDYTKNALIHAFFEPTNQFEIESSSVCSYKKDTVQWSVDHINTPRPFYQEKIGHHVLQGKGKIHGKLLGGCVDVFIEILGTSIWPSLEEWRHKILFIETSEMDMPDYELCWILRNLGAQGIFNVINGMIVGKPVVEEKIELYNKVIQQVVGFEYKKPDLPIMTNVNFGHAEPIGIIPYGQECQLDLDHQKISILESITK